MWQHWAGRKLLCRGGGDTEAHFPNPPPPSLLGRRDGRGGSGRGRPTCHAGGGGVNPTSMAQNDTHVELIIFDYSNVGGGNDWWKELFRAKFCVPVPTSVLTQNKGPDREPHFSNPPPLLRRASMSPPPPPPRRAIFRLPWMPHFFAGVGAIPPHITMADKFLGSHGGRGRAVAIFAPLSTFIIAQYCLAVLSTSSFRHVSVAGNPGEGHQSFFVTACRRSMSALSQWGDLGAESTTA